MRFGEVDGSPVPNKIIDEVREVKRRTGAVLNSCYRGSDPGATNILKRFGKATQAWLYRAYWILHLPGYRPANRPGQSTHECFNDGIAYRGPVGMPLSDEKVGMDWEIAKVGAVIKAFAELGWIATLTYPGSALEAQHINIHKMGRQFRPFKILKRGARGRRVRHLRYQLWYIRPGHFLDHRHDVGGEDGHFGSRIEAGLMRFQREHHQKADGIYGEQTHHQLQAIYRERRRAEKATKKKLKKGRVGK